MAKMERLNRVGSPIDICDGNLDPKPEVLEKKKKEIESIQRAKSRILDWNFLTKKYEEQVRTKSNLTKSKT